MLVSDIQGHQDHGLGVAGSTGEAQAGGKWATASWFSVLALEQHKE